MAGALAIYEEERLKNLEYQSRPLANLGVVTARLHGVKQPDTTWFNEYELIQRKREANKYFSPKLAKKYVELHNDCIIPAWVDEMTDLDKMKLAAIE